MQRYLLALLPVAFAAPAFAGNIEPAPLEPAPVFTAPTVSSPVYDWTGFYIGAQANYADVETGGDLETDGDGGLLGVRAGYDFDFGPAVAGGFVQYDNGGIELDDTDVELENVLRVGARVGYDFGPNLVYGSAGYANADTDDAGSADGYFVGLGYERFLTQSVSLGAEAIYHDFNDFDGIDGANVDAEATTVGLNINYRF